MENDMQNGRVDYSKYKVIDIFDPDYNEVMQYGISTESNNRHGFVTDVTPEFQAFDESVFFYVPDDVFEKSDEEIAAYVSKEVFGIGADHPGV